MYRGEKRERSGRDLFLHSLSPSLSLPCQREGECDDVERERGRRERRASATVFAHWHLDVRTIDLPFQ